VADIQDHGGEALQRVSNAMVRLHKEQFGRGATNVRTDFAGKDMLVCMLQDILLPAERKLVEMGEQERVRESRIAFQAATQDEFIAAVEEIVDRKVAGFASGIDPDNNVVFETFYFQPRDGDGDGDGDGDPTAP
jgi:uncharacterized protein YbcI